MLYEQSKVKYQRNWILNCLKTVYPSMPYNLKNMH